MMRGSVAAGPPIVLHIHWLDHSFDIVPEADSAVDFPEPAMAVDYAFDLYMALDGFDRGWSGFALKDESGGIVHQWQSGTADQSPAPDLSARGGPVASTLSAAGRSRKTRARIAAPWSPVVYRPLAAAVALAAVLGNLGVDRSPLAQLTQTASADVTGRIPGATAEGRSAYVSPPDAGARGTAGRSRMERAHYLSHRR